MTATTCLLHNQTLTMADSLPIPVPPRTPTPPSDDGRNGLGIPLFESHANVFYDPNSLSPMIDKSATPTPTTAFYTPAEPQDGPFNFQTTVMSNSPVIKSVSYSKCIKIVLIVTEYWTKTRSQVQAQ